MSDATTGAAAEAPPSRSAARRAGWVALRLFPRVMGGITVVYAVLVLVAPATMLAPMGLAPGEAGMDALARAMLVRDLACGAAMVLVPAGWPLLTAIAVRVASDFGDALVLGLSLPDPGARLSAVLAAGGFGTLCALSALGAQRSR
ncbi:hypothetical protein [Streptomonospora litoralis]|uniref:Uncharacterized protein n=1 Tax=Streptomonospora litoralis TaxID=2498135 RepID=A0A4P6Q6B6_9ACTN|nr:hypothetical protein [Streptomonospora litoralis]QBI54579.1 hypothetical protein EKD16_13990 [Streptomonospora litoralis]